MAKPVRQKRHDRILHGSGASQAEIRCDMATGPFDEAVLRMDRKWGVDRLPELVSPATADKWGLAMAQLNEAISSEDYEMTVARVGVCLRGIAAMDAEAEAAGQPKSNPDVWEYEYDGHRFGIIADGREWPAAKEKRPDLTIYSMREVAVALHAHRNAVAAVKASFPGAEVTKIQRPLTALEKELDDEIRF